MSIASRITAIEEHIGNIYDTLELGGADLTNVNKNLINVDTELKKRYLDYLNNGTDEIWNNWEKATAKDVTEATLNDTDQAPMKIKLKGNTVQDGTPTPDNPIPIQNIVGNVEIKIQNENLLNLAGLENVGGSNVTSVITDTEVQITQSISSNYAYRRYTTNLDINKYKGKTLVVSGISNTSNTRIYICLLKEDKTLLGNLETTITIPNNTEAYYIGLQIYCSYGVSNQGTIIFSNLQLEQGSTESPYIPHEEQNYPLTLGDIELCKIDTAQDYFYKENNKWYLHKEIGKTVFDENTTYTYFSAGSSDTTNAYRLKSIEDIKPYTLYTQAPEMKNTKFSAVPQSASWNPGFVSRLKSNPKVVIFLIEKSQTADDLKNILNGEPLYYILETPVNTEITSTTLIAQLEALSKAYSYTDQTNISQTSEDLPFILDIEALKKI